MSKISIDLDLAVVQKALHAKVQPAVDKILAGYDLSAMIVKELERVEPVGESDMYGLMLHQAMRSMHGGKTKPEPVIVGMIQTAINDAAKVYVKENLTAQKPRLEAAFKKMIEGSSNRLAKTFLASAEDALANNWSFELTSTVSPKEPERDYD